ncbi:hypothetical protein [Spiroplasma platyhelix]|uniref:Uncharacterized protein n=1 Tax=Spiroplasma platyhelix PALS-1 TaxID=1276218 RepID=A0A846TQE3_9MOLU|nr:hypothetical protein [Spiroplasma platyhelix]MBE4704168.1 hypothetical protein [Spiroplasma platyhelix PALS-1]NKE38540.1 hypothetical protein [Spiroplasma platyhelix PALS-1]UJB29426.1 hypothetical protein SPLAT_v1c06620 [Spiroplasma platyhelix PALS-1]
MELIFTTNQEKLKKSILNNFQIDLLYKLVTEYVKLRFKDKNKLSNKYIINQFDSLIQFLDIVDGNLNKKIYFEDYFKHEKKYNLKLPIDFKKLENEIIERPYYKQILKKWIFLYVLTIDKKIQDEVFLEIYDAFDKHYNEKHCKEETIKKYSYHHNDIIKYPNPNQKTINKVNKEFNNHHFDKLNNYYGNRTYV